MRDDEYDLDVTAAQPIDDAAIAALSRDELIQAIVALPPELRMGMGGILLEKRTYSDVSQELGIRQAELVRQVHRGRALISRQLAAREAAGEGAAG
ncbi:hypothetical protein OVN18_08745 [Microcella daejeonensis]|uniref:Uncharacterized protein n=1 Tax=Microcella daejeonensis TaxID=2994971 RepID=A0A9E8MJE8_9MICO|nr:hypothetical protein [Microcella daejeonensis]WAB80655.1 hypothetical protein OVN18_08745 [Microcella daejeonensis]